MSNRSKVKLTLIPDESKRKETLKRRKRSFIRKLQEITTLCDVPAAVVISSKYDSVPEAWPPQKEDFDKVVSKFKALTTREQTKNMMDQKTYLMTMIKKGEEQVKKLRSENRDFQMQELFFDCLRGNTDKYNLDDEGVRALHAYVQEYFNKLNRRIEILTANGQSPSMHPPTDNGQSSSMHPLTDNGQPFPVPPHVANGQSSSFSPPSGQSSLLHRRKESGHSTLPPPHRVNNLSYSSPPPRENGQFSSLPHLRENGNPFRIHEENSQSYPPLADNGQSSLLHPRKENVHSSLLTPRRVNNPSYLPPPPIENAQFSSLPHLRENGNSFGKSSQSYDPFVDKGKSILSPLRENDQFSSLLSLREKGKSSLPPLPDNGQSYLFPRENGQSSFFPHIMENGHSSSIPPISVAEAVPHDVANVASLLDADKGAATDSIDDFVASVASLLDADKDAATDSDDFDFIQYLNMDMNDEVQHMNQDHYQPLQDHAPHVGVYDQMQRGIQDVNQDQNRNMSMQQNQYQPVQYQAPHVGVCDQIQHGIQDVNQAHDRNTSMQHNQKERVQYQAYVGFQNQHRIHDMNPTQNMSMQHNQYQPVQYQTPHAGVYDKNQHGGQNMNPNHYFNQQQSFTGQMIGHPEQQMGYTGENANTSFMDGNNYHYNQPATVPPATTGHMSSITSAATTDDAFVPYTNNYRY